ncbi:MAG: hypothetical protein DSY46_02250 [Hydrogenimonas sp.]|nr:MAG: hypothetical protein DSY46_02250 [Hydrogenimonas sp.]
MKESYYLKVRLLSPVHIGTGEYYEPTNFIIHNHHLYEFDPFAFYRELDEQKRHIFNDLVAQADPGIFIRLHAFIQAHHDIAISLAHHVVPVSEGIVKEYETKIGDYKAYDREHKERGFKQFQMMRTQRLTNLKMPYISGSSLKGAISTAYQSMLYQKDFSAWRQHFKELRNPTLSPMKNLLLSDLHPIQSDTKIGYALNKERFEEGGHGPSIRVEAMMPETLFVGRLELKSFEPRLLREFETIADACNEHYLPILASLFSHQEMTPRYVSETFKQKIASLKLDKNRFIVRVGRYSGARSVTIEGLRAIMVTLCDLKHKSDSAFEQIEAKIERLYKKSYFENHETVERLMTDEKLLNPKELRTQLQSYHFMKKPSELEETAKTIKRLAIKCYLTEETTSWFFSDKEESENQMLPFGWLLCERIGRDEYHEVFAKSKHI